MYILIIACLSQQNEAFIITVGMTYCLIRSMVSGSGRGTQTISQWALGLAKQPPGARLLLTCAQVQCTCVLAMY